MKPEISFLRPLLAGIALSALQPSALAAPITWGPATNVSTGSGNSADVSTTGLPVEAFNAQASDTLPASPVVNGVTFVGTQTLLSEVKNLGANDMSSGTNGGDASYDLLLSDVDYGGGGASATISIGGGALSVGEDYEVQIWFVDDRDGFDDRVMRFGDGNGNTVDLNDQFSIGTFTADGANQNISLAAQGFGRAHITAYQLRFVPSGPPPAPDTPTNLVATGGDAEIVLDWDDNTQYGFANFIVKRATVSGGPYTAVPGATPATSSYTDTGLTNGTTYYYVVAAENTEGQVSGNSDEDSATPEVFVPDPPEVPTGLVATPGNNRNTLNWDDNTQPGFLEFRVKRATVEGGPYSQIGATANSILTDFTADNGTTYYYVVTAVNSDNVESAPSAEVDATPAPASTPPNFLFIITDDQDTYTVGAYRSSEPVEPGAGGSPYLIDTPHIDRLAAEGMLFHQARLMGSDVGAVCTASRTCIMTGKNTWQRTQGASAPFTLPGIFNRGVRSGSSDIPYATYRTCKVGNSYSTANGEFTIVNDATKRGNTDGNGSEWHRARALEHIAHWEANHRPNGKPFLMYLGFSHPHDVRNARTTPNLTGRYGCINTTNPASLGINPDAPPLPFNHLSCTPATYPAHPFDHGHLNVRDEVDVSGVLKYRTEAVIRNEMGRQFACVDWIDQQIGLVLARLEDPDNDGDPSDSVIDNTYIVFTSDHGMSIGRHGLQGKQNLYEHTWRVPYIVRGPGIAPGSENDALIYLHDTFPTFCDLAGLDIPATIDGNDGQSFRAVLEGTSTTARDHVYGLYAGGSTPGMRAVTDGRFKLIKYDVGSNATQVTQMFDILENPFELLPEHGVADLATHPAYARVRARLEEQMMEQRRLNADSHQFLGDRTLLRFEEGPAGTLATVLQDRFPWDNDGTNSGGVYAADVPHVIDLVNGEPNTLSLDLDAGDSISIPDDRALDMGTEPFTLEAYVKLGTLPSSGNLIPVISKGGDYSFYAGAGSAGNPNNGLSLRLGGTVVHSTLAITDSNWHYLSAALDPVANQVRFVLDDQVEILSTTASGSVNNNPVILGGGAFDGLLDEVSITVGFLAEEELQPVDPSTPDPFRIIELVLDPADPADLNLTFESVETRLYSIQRSPDLLPGSWTDLRTFIPGAAGASRTTVADLPRDPGATAEFFRVTIEP